MALILGGLLAGCGSQTGSGPSTDKSASPAAEPTDLTCPDGERVGTDGGLLAQPPDGFDTPEEAVESWLTNTKNADDYVLSADGKGACILRDNGTAHTKVSFIRSSGYTVHGYEACSS
jgi:hypothetical protein